MDTLRKTENRFSFSQLNRSSGEVVDAAMSGPVVLHKNGKDKLVLLRTEDYERLLEARLAQREAYTSENLPEEHKKALIEGFDAFLSED